SGGSPTRSAPTGTSCSCSAAGTTTRKPPHSDGDKPSVGRRDPPTPPQPRLLPPVRGRRTAREGPERPRSAATVSGLLRHLLDGLLELLATGGATGLGGHELGHVALHLHLAGHERLHARLRVPRHEHVFRGLVVGC